MGTAAARLRLQLVQIVRHADITGKMLPAIDIDELAIDEAGHVGGQEDHHGADVVFRIARALERIAGGRHFQEAGHIVHQRSEEHTSELQSLMRISYADLCLKKKQKTEAR